MQYGFGSGNLTGVRTDLPNQTPAVFGVVQDTEIDFDFSLKDLIGQYQAPVAIARAGLKTTFKVSSARIYAQIYNELFFGQNITTGGQLSAINEAGQVPASSVYTIQVTGHATFLVDQGVFYAATGIQLQRVASSPAAGQYSVAAGVYTFAAADASANMLLNYTYTTSTGSQEIVVNNELQGAAPTFQMNFTEQFQSKIFNIQLNACVASKLTFPAKNQDFIINDFEGEAYADAAGVIALITTSE